MKRIAVALMTVGVMFFLTAAAQAGFLNPAENPEAAPFTCEFPGSQNQHNWEFDYNPDAPTLTMEEIISSASLDNVIMSGETDEDPTFTVVKKIENTTGIHWTGYTVTLSGSAVPTFIEGSASVVGDKFDTIEYPHPAALVFSGGPGVPSGQSVKLQFDINVPTCGLFDFTLTQSPVPEPATIGLLSLGSLVLFRKRRVKC